MVDSPTQNGTGSRKVLAYMLLYAQMFFEGNSSVSCATRNAIAVMLIYFWWYCLSKLNRYIKLTWVVGTQVVASWGLQQVTETFLKGCQDFFVIEYAYFTCWRLKHFFGKHFQQMHMLGPYSRRSYSIHKSMFVHNL